MRRRSCRARPPPRRLGASDITHARLDDRIANAKKVAEWGAQCGVHSSSSRGRWSGLGARVSQPVNKPDVLAEDFSQRRLRQRGHELSELLHVVPGVIRMREVGRPEEAVGTDELDYLPERLLVG